MKILITAPSLNPDKNVSGVASVVNSIIKHNKQHCYYHYLLGRPDKPMNILVWIIQVFKQISFFPVYLKKNKIDLVHQNLPLDPKGVTREYLINVWCRVMKVPVMLHIHGGLFITQGTKNIIFKKLAQSLFKHSHQLVVLSEIEREALSQNFGFSMVNILPNCIDTSIFKSEPKKHPHEKPNLLYLGRIEKNKGLYELIEALRLLKKDFCFQFVLCGTGSLTENCIKEFTKSLGNSFEYKGVITGDIKTYTIKQADIFILPSYFEGLPMALLETMAAGVVPVVTDVGSMKHIIQHGTNGLIIKKHDPKDLYNKLKTVLSDSLLFQKMSANASKTISNQYDVTKYVIQLNDIYKATLDVKN